jgi:quercetin dioxygenase-like cupin family protein
MNNKNVAAAVGAVQVRNGAAPRSRPVGVTTGSSRRPVQRVVGEALAFDLGSFVEDLWADEGWPAGEPNSVTLVKEPTLRVILVALHAGARMKEHQVPGRLSIQTIAGRARLHLAGRVVDLGCGHLVALEAGLRHDLEALEESAILLTIAWPAPPV